MGRNRRSIVSGTFGIGGKQGFPLERSARSERDIQSVSSTASRIILTK